MASTAQRRNIARLLRPASIAFIGGKDLRLPIDSCRKIGFTGEMWAVNPHRGQIAGMPCYRSLDDLPAVPDAAFVAVNAGLTAGVLRELNRIGAGGAVGYAAGFAELGEGGRALQQELVEASGDLAVLGPNCYGLLNYLDGVALWADTHGGERVGEGVAVVSQSGNVSLNLTMAERSLPLAQVIAVGNQAVLGPGDFIEPLLDDPRIKAIGLYMEGLDDVETFSRAALKALERGVPLVVLKSGRSAVATRITASHTASLAGEDRLYDALFERLGVLRVSSLTAFVETLKMLGLHGPLAGDRLGVVACSGGDAALLADVVDREGLTLPSLTEVERAEVGEHVTRITTIENPLDYNTVIWGRRDEQEGCFAAVMRARMDATALILDYARDGLPGAECWDIAVDALIGASKRTGALGVVVATLPELLPARVRSRLIAAGLVPLQGLEEAIIALGAAWRYHRRRSEILEESALDTLLLPAARLPDGVVGTLDEGESKRLLAEYGLPLAPGRVVGRDELAAAAADLGYPLVLKALAPDLIHKTEAGAVALGLSDEAALLAAAARMRDLGDRFLLERMVEDAMAEVIVGVKNDPRLGLALLIGSGGVLAELVADVAWVLLPCGRAAMAAAISGLKVAKVIEGHRGRPAGDLDALLDAIQAIADTALAERERLVELDVNPILVRPRGQGVVAVDATIRLAKDEM
jgi:acyl-CoA synthetase (NDP forming)